MLLQTLLTLQWVGAFTYLPVYAKAFVCHMRP
jgi:hypothetical protein